MACKRHSKRLAIKCVSNVADEGINRIIKRLVWVDVYGGNKIKNRYLRSA